MGLARANAQYMPYWSRVPGFTNHMNVMGQIELDGTYLASPAIEVGAFCGAECRGSASLEDMAGTYMVLQTISADVEGNVITFRLYDHEAGHENGAVCHISVLFFTNY